MQKEQEFETIDENYFCDAEPKMVDYLTEQGIEAVKIQDESFCSIRSRSHTLANILTTGIGGSAMLFISVAEKGNIPFLSGLGVLIIGWGLCLYLLIKKVLIAQTRYTPFTSPLKLYDSEPENLLDLKRKRLYDYSYAEEHLCDLSLKAAKTFNLAMKSAVVVSVFAALLTAILSFLACL